MNQLPPPPPPEKGNSRPRFDIHPPVFFASAGLIVLFVVLTLVSLDTTGSFFAALQAGIARWFLILVVNIYLLFSRFAHIRLGGPDPKPEFGYWSWFAMLFSAGMGIGLLFYSVAEPMYHLSDPPVHGVAPGSIGAAVAAMAITSTIGVSTPGASTRSSGSRWRSSRSIADCR